MLRLDKMGTILNNHSNFCRLMVMSPIQLITILNSLVGSTVVNAKLPSRSRIVESRKKTSNVDIVMNSRVYGKNTKPARRELPIEGPNYRRKNTWAAEDNYQTRRRRNQLRGQTFSTEESTPNTNLPFLEAQEFERELGSQLTGCCTTYSSYSANDLCYKYGNYCNTGDMMSHDSGDSSCEMVGLSFIGYSFSVNTANGNPYSYQLCDQFPMENLIDRDYQWVMSMDEDGWLVGGGYKSFDFSGKMPYIDSSHTELLRIGSMDPEYGGTTIEQVYDAMSTLSFPPFSVFPEYVKGGGGHHSSDDSDSSSVPSGDVTLIVSIVETYDEGLSYSDYENFLYNLFDAMWAVGGGPCMDDHDTDPHVSMARGVKFKSSYHSSEYFYTVNMEVAVWQAMYPYGVPIGSTGKANFPPNNAGRNQQPVNYGNLYFFFDRANITKAFPANRDLTSDESYYALLTQNDYSYFYDRVSSISFDYNKASGSKQNSNNVYYEHNPYAWNAKMAKHDMTDGWDLPPNCYQEGETFLGIPLSRASSSKLQSTSTFQDQFDFEYLVDRNYTYMKKFGTNHGWLIGEMLGNGPGSIVDKDTSHIPLFYTGTTNPDMGGMSLADIIKVVNSIDFGTLYIKPAFLFQDSDGAVKLQFEADSNSALGYLYDNLCKMLGLTWNYDSPYNTIGKYTNCAMHAAGDRASYGCGVGNGNNGGFCPQMTLAYRVKFQSTYAAKQFFARGNDYVDYWRSLYPSGVAVGTSKFCKDGGCLGLFLNRYDLYQVFKPNLGGSWVEYNGATFAPTISPAPSADGGCDNPHNRHLDKCFQQVHKQAAARVAWQSLGSVGQLSVFLVTFMSVTLSISIFIARLRRKKHRNESVIGFVVRDLMRDKKKRDKKKKLRRKIKNLDSADENLLDSGDGEVSSRRRSSSRAQHRSKSRSKSKSGRSKSRSRHESSRHVEEEDISIPSSRSHRESSRARGSSRKRSPSHSHRKNSSSHDNDNRRSSRSRSKRRDDSPRPSNSSRTRSQSKSRGGNSNNHNDSNNNRGSSSRNLHDSTRRQLV